MVICLEQGANDLHMVQLMPLPHCHLLLQQNPEWLNVCVCVSMVTAPFSPFHSLEGATLSHSLIVLVQSILNM